jgi:hypothetical protein
VQLRSAEGEGALKAAQPLLHAEGDALAPDQEQLLALGDDPIDLLDRTFHAPSLRIAADPVTELLGDLIVGDAEGGDHVCQYACEPGLVEARDEGGEIAFTRVTSHFLSGR